jgi:hypothetical protein
MLGRGWHFRHGYGERPRFEGRLKDEGAFMEYETCEAKNRQICYLWKYLRFLNSLDLATIHPQR